MPAGDESSRSQKPSNLQSISEDALSLVAATRGKTSPYLDSSRTLVRRIGLHPDGKRVAVTADAASGHNSPLDVSESEDDLTWRWRKQR